MAASLQRRACENLGLCIINEGSGSILIVLNGNDLKLTTVQSLQVSVKFYLSTQILQVQNVWSLD